MPYGAARMCFNSTWLKWHTGMSLILSNRETPRKNIVCSSRKQAGNMYSIKFSKAQIVNFIKLYILSLLICLYINSGLTVSVRH